MATRFRPYHPDQGLLLPPDLRDWLPAGHLVRILVITFTRIRSRQGFSLQFQLPALILLTGVATNHTPAKRVL